MAPKKVAPPKERKPGRWPRNIWNKFTKSPLANTSGGDEGKAISEAETPDRQGLASPVTTTRQEALKNNNLVPQIPTPSFAAGAELSPVDTTEHGSLRAGSNLPQTPPVVEVLPDPAPPLPPPELVDEAAQLWTEAYVTVSEEDADLVNVYELILTEQSGLGYALVGTANMFIGCSGPARMELMASVASSVVKKTAKHADLVDGVATAAEMVATVASGIGKLLDAYPPAAMALSGIAAALPVLVKPVTAQKLMAACLKHVLEHVEWYVSLSRTLLRDSWSDVDDFAQHRQTVRKTILGLYKNLLHLEMSCICQHHNPRYIVTAVKNMLSIIDWEADLKSLKELEKDVNDKIDQYNKQEIVKHLNDISSHGSDMTKELKVATDTLERIRTRQEAWQAEQSKQHRDNVRAQLNTLIGKFNTTPYKAYMTRNKYRVRNTCKWFCDHRKFRDWISSDSDPLLVVSALPGCGKSTLANYLVEHVLPELQPDATICYFFFKDDNREQRSTASALCAILHHLFDEQSERADFCKDHILRFGEKLFADTELLWDVFKEAVGCSIDHTGNFKNRVICVLDALDECEPSELRTLLKHIDELLKTDEDGLNGNGGLQIKFLMTTRPYQEIIQQIRVMESRVLQLAGEDSEEIDKIQEEISLVVDYRLTELVRMKGLEDETEDIIRRSLGEHKSMQRTYLWVKLIFEVLESNYDDNPDEWRKLIRDPPQTIFGTYEKLLGRVREKDKAFVRLLVSLIYIATRPLTLGELNVAIECRNHISAKEMPRLSSDAAFRTRVLNACGFFVTCYNDQLFFIHQTVREFLDPTKAFANAEKSCELSGETWRLSISPSAAHRAMAESCIAYLSLRSVRRLEPRRLLPIDGFSSFKYCEIWRQLLLGEKIHNRVYYGITEAETERLFDSILEQLREHFVFFGYVICNWTEHFRLAQILSGSDLAEDVGETFVDPYLELFHSDMPASRTWAWSLNLFQQLSNDFEIVQDDSLTLADTGPYIAMISGHIRPLEVAHARGETFPCISVYDQDSRLVRERGTLAQISNTLVGWAKTRGSCDALGYLLDVFPQIVRNNGGQLLRDACFTESPILSVISLLLDRGASVNSKTPVPEQDCNDRYSSALQAALSSFSPLHVQDSLINRLLEGGAEAWATTANGNTPLHNLVLNRRKNFEYLVWLFIHYGADINAVDRRGATPLVLMCDFAAEPVAPGPGSSGSVFVHKAIKTLTRFGADPSLQDDYGCTALHMVAAQGMLMSVLELIRSGVDVMARTKRGHTPLHMACMSFAMYFHENTSYRLWSSLALPLWSSLDHKFELSMAAHFRKCVSHSLPLSRPPSVSSITRGTSKRLASNNQDGNSTGIRHFSRSPSLGDLETRADVPFEDAPSMEAVADALAEDQSSSSVENGPRDSDNIIAGLVTPASRRLSTYSRSSSSISQFSKPSTSRGRSRAGAERRRPFSPSSRRSSTFSAHFSTPGSEASFIADESKTNSLVDSSVRGTILSHLVTRGADVNARDDEGCTPLHWAALAGDLFAAEILLRQLGASADVRNREGQTALHLACAGGRRMWQSLKRHEWLGFGEAGEEAARLRRALVGLLLDRGADAAAVDSKGWSARELARCCWEKGLGEFVLERVARLEASRAIGEVVVELGSEREEEVARRLREDMAWRPVGANRRGRSL